MPPSKRHAGKRKLSVKIASNAPSAEASLDLSDSSLFFNRELTLLAFQRRVLEEAENKQNPLLERVKFLAILGSNLDEFYMVRVAGLLAQIDAGIVETSADGMSPRAQLTAIRRESKRLLKEAYACFDGELLPALKESGISVLEYRHLTKTQAANACQFFKRTAFPVLTPLAFDPGRPFPHISNLSLSLAVAIRDRKGEQHFARVKLPDSLPPLVSVGASGLTRGTYRRPPKKLDLVWLEEIVAANLDALFPGMEILEAHPFHVTRDADIAIRELEAEDLLETVEEGVRQRRFGQVVRLMVADDMPRHMLRILVNNLEIDSTEIYRTHNPIGLARLRWLYSLDRPELKDGAFVPAIPADLTAHDDEVNIFDLIARQDVLLHHPYDSFQPVVDFLRKAAQDDDVLAIKIVLYRVGRNSPIVDALLEAMENGKQVAVLVELKARFDEESNIEWARKLEKEGVHVVYGLLGLKIHCKVAMVVRREGNAMRRYVHLGTGNYNAVTSHLYTDLGLLTSDETLAEDVTDLFNFLTGYSAKTTYRRLLVAPVNLRSSVKALIEREIKHKSEGKSAGIVFKLNSLIDPEMIRSLYRASQVGIKIQLIVRGMCSLRPGVPGVSENIEVISIVGRFLEHSRIFYFENNGEQEIYLGSSDLMQRNLDRRVEVLFPISDQECRRRIANEILPAYLADTAKARVLSGDGSYKAKAPSGRNPAYNAQEQLMHARSVSELDAVRRLPKKTP